MTTSASEPEQISELRKQFKKLYKCSPDIYIIAPGRVEVIGNHTDYNHGYALSACISQKTIGLFKKRDDKLVNIYSNDVDDSKAQPFEISPKLTPDKKQNWANYIRGVFKEFAENDVDIPGCDILLDSNIPMGTGFSSSAALELTIAYGAQTLGGYEIDKLSTALMCQRVENQFVGSPCGFLDQGTISFGKKDHLVFMDFLPKENSPVSKTDIFPCELDKHNCSFILAVDREVKRELGTCGYPARRKMCEDSLAFWCRVLDREVESLREITPEIFDQYRDELDRFNQTMRKRVEHVVRENQRVLDSIEALRNDDIETFGEKLTKSGESALYLYELDEETPELTFLFENGRELDGVIGIRNMGGGFATPTLALVTNDKLESFQDQLKEMYEKEFTGKLEFVEFEITDGIEVKEF